MTSPQPLDTPIARVLSKVKAKGAGSGRWMAICPAHEDRNASLSIKVGNDGRVLLNCHAGCTAEAVVGAIGMKMTELFAEPLKRENAAPGPDPRRVHDLGRVVCHYRYTDANGNTIYRVTRYEPKDFRPFRPENGRWVMGLGDVKPVLYRLPEVIEALALKKRIYLCEGEKDADNLVAAGWVATTNSGGAKKWEPSFTQALAGGDIVIFEDNDPAGADRSASLAPELTAAGCTVRVVKLKGLPEKGDVSDWFDQGGDIADLEELVNRTQPYGPKRVKWKLSELWNSESVMRPPAAVVPRLAWAGRSTLLAAREKSGKSTLIGYITARVSKGEQFLNEYCISGDVLIVGLEEYLGDVARRLKHFGADGEKVTLVDGFLGASKTRAEEIAAHIDDLTPVLVIVDSLVAFANDRGIDENDAAMATIVQPLTDLAHASGTALVIVHHANKTAGKARGSTAITGATDVVCEFSTPDEDTDPTNRRMRSVGRVPLIRQFDMRFDGDTYTLADGQKAPVESRIIAVVRDRPGISTNDVAQAVGGNRSDAINALHRMQAERVVENKSDTFARARWVVPAERLI